MTLVVLLAGGLILALRPPGDSVALQAAQSTLVGLCQAARVAATLTGQSARLLVSAEQTDAAEQLRYLQIVHEDPVASGRWIAPGSGVWLPRGVYLVPPVIAAVPGNPAWPSSRRSTALATTAQNMTINGVSAGQFYYLQFTPRGTTGGGTLVLTIGRTTGPDLTAVTLDSPDCVRGVLLRSSGACTLLNDAGAFAP